MTSPRLPKRVLKAANVRHDEIEPLAKTARHVFEPGGAHLLQVAPSRCALCRCISTISSAVVPARISGSGNGGRQAMYGSSSRAGIIIRPSPSRGSTNCGVRWFTASHWFRYRGSRASRRLSPTILQARATLRIASPGRRRSTTGRSSCARSRSSNPIRAIGGGPRRKLSAAKVRIACPEIERPGSPAARWCWAGRDGRTCGGAWRRVLARRERTACRVARTSPRTLRGIRRPPGDHDGDDRVAHPAPRAAVITIARMTSEKRA